ncbi:MAG: hypothetical protein U0570_05855 [Phycisphaerales bacterium]
MRTSFYGALPCAIVALLADAQLVLTADQRALSVEAAGTSEAGFPPNPFAPFFRDLSLDVPAGTGRGRARAVQQSTVTTSELHATGSSSGAAEAAPDNCVLSQATSDFRITFRVATPVSYTMDGAVDGAQFRLTESFAGVRHLAESEVGTSLPFSFAGILKPGRDYLLLAQSSQLSNACEGNSFSLEGSYSFNGSFTALASCAGDLNFDRVVDDADFQIFLAAYNTLLCPASPEPCDADLDADGVVVDRDFEIFLASYNRLLCP